MNISRRGFLGCLLGSTSLAVAGESAIISVSRLLGWTADATSVVVNGDFYGRVVNHHDHLTDALTYAWKVTYNNHGFLAKRVVGLDMAKSLGGYDRVVSLLFDATRDLYEVVECVSDQSGEPDDHEEADNEEYV